MEVLNSIQAKIDEMNQKISDLQKELTEFSKKGFSEVFREFFDKNPQIENIFWRQYTPYFNDGEPCEFSVHDVSFTLVGDDDSDSDSEGSDIPNENTIKYLKRDIGNWKAYNADPIKYCEGLVSGRRDMFNPDLAWGKDRNKTREQLMREYRPAYQDLEVLEKKLVWSKDFLSKNPNLNANISVVRTFINSIPNDTMLQMFGDHARVVVTRGGIEIEEYNHD
jgi:hypothetical protein